MHEFLRIAIYIVTLISISRYIARKSAKIFLNTGENYTSQKIREIHNLANLIFLLVSKPTLNCRTVQLFDVLAIYII